MNVWALVRMLPHVGLIGLTPKPRKLTNASPMMLPATIRVAATTIGRERVGQDVAEDDPPVANADRPRRLDELALADRQEEAPHEAADPHPAEEPEDQDDRTRRCRAGPEEARDDEDDEERSAG